MADPSFYYAIFKKLQAAAGGNVYPGSGHVNDDDQSGELSGGFSLRQTQDMFGLYQHLSPHAPDFTVDDSVNPPTKLNSAMMPLNPNSTDPLLNPLFVMLKTSLTPGGVPLVGNYFFVKVNGQTWPVMPPPSYPDGTVSNANWAEFNASAPKLIDQFESWITAGKIDDAPKGAPLAFASLMQSLPPPFPGLSVQDNWPLLFVASMAGDDGRRNGDHAMPVVPLDHVPPHYWNTSQIFLTDKSGNIVFPPALKPTEEYYVAAVIGNAGNWGAGRCFQGVPGHMWVHGDALAFNTFMSPNVSLPALSNLDPTAKTSAYEQYFLAKQYRDVVGFRFNVDDVFKRLNDAMVAHNFTPAQLGGMSTEEWLKDSHPCVKIRITAGENDNTFKPEGNAPLKIDSNPRKDRHIAQRNLAPFDMTVMALSKIQWKNFIVSQAGAGLNGLALEHALPADAFQLYVAIAREPYERYIAKGGAVRGFTVVREGTSKPFPDAVILHQTAKAAEIRIADHAKEVYFGMSLGIAGDPARIKGQRIGDVTMVHTAHDGSIMGGFTLRPVTSRAG